ncbi:MAG TPA: DUF5615 family PIN-like protein [Candidatus Thiothrix moscowensis]|uniref:DUF5615 family PIN-like protein n=1 Tax=unclassified Thiothrix TaxID=2636184 RepID=UPI0025D20C55|nr:MULTISPECIES: DUF5615 family PIN-like protein [unclassified Thiothrix]HRJ54119.1 DUF5615 family PIN-like protein [Candidatus Thiothrix moscowensis]HRJ94389.1 DUF5615 family PIN-like protein [Candidatus Thiothrix moscowensis]
MRFIVDAQLPPALARFLASLGEDAIHVLDAGLLEAVDSEIWSFALENDWVIITKDDDFQFRASVSKHYPKIVWVRVGNCSKQKLLEIFKKHWTAIKRELEAGAFLVEVV